MSFELLQVSHDGNELIRGDLFAINHFLEVSSKFYEVIDRFTGAFAVGGIFQLGDEAIDPCYDRSNFGDFIRFLKGSKATISHVGEVIENVMDRSDHL